MFNANYKILKLFNNFKEYIKYRISMENGNSEYRFVKREKLDYGIEEVYCIPLSVDRVNLCSHNSCRLNHFAGIINSDGCGWGRDFSTDNIELDEGLEKIARMVFNIQVVPKGDFETSIDLANKGFGVFLIEDSRCQIYLPHNMTNNCVAGIIKTINDIERYTFYIVRDNQATAELEKQDVLKYLKSLYTYKDSSNDLSIYDYLKELVLHIGSNNKSIFQYFYDLADNIINFNLSALNDFERRSPIIKESDIKELLANGSRHVFAIKMSDLVMDYIRNDALKQKDDDTLDKNTINDAINESFENNEDKVKITSINNQLLLKLDGFTVIREEKLGIINIFGFEHDDSSNLKYGTTQSIGNKNIQSGHYINIVDFISNLKNEYQGDITFITPKNEEFNFDVVMDAALNLSHDAGLIRFGKDYTNQDINKYKDLKDKYDGSKGKYGVLQLTKGYYVNRDILANFFSKLRIKTVTKAKEKTYTF